MKLFECQHCGQPLFFDNKRCESCGYSLGYLPDQRHHERAGAGGGGMAVAGDAAARYRYCANEQYDICNWMIAGR